MDGQDDRIRSVEYGIKLSQSRSLCYTVCIKCALSISSDPKLNNQRGHTLFYHFRYKYSLFIISAHSDSGSQFTDPNPSPLEETLPHPPVGYWCAWRYSNPRPHLLTTLFHDELSPIDLQG
ncbi:hypothetical protein F2Q68_00042282 [Brassica cretica]|uniref:Uncharacterized protein n=1 Tax=Brassica cretica TaxID=69181 RepID=A0A8S9M943_BRACR|nr:hypothetical protein F2Q68_00042282 [Brassica cretica]